jgi:hypothetical protein
MTAMRRAAALLVVPMALFALGARAEGPLYEIKKGEPKVAAGAKATASLTIATKNGWHVNAEAPITVALTAPAGISVSKAKLSRGDLAQSSAESARFDIPFEASEAGAKIITAEAKFVLCQESACKPVKETLALNIDVAPAVAAVKAKPKKK